MVKCFGVIEGDKDDLSTQDIPVLIELTDEHITAIKKAVDFVKQNPFITNVSIDLCQSLPRPGFTVVDTNTDFKKSFEAYSYLYARVFEDSIALGASYVVGLDVIDEENYFGYIETNLFFKEAQIGLVVFGDYIADRLYNHDEFGKAILECLGKDMLKRIADIEGIPMEDIPIAS